MCVVGAGDRVGVKMLIAAGASVHDTDRDGSTSLHKAADKGRDKVALMLIENGANIDSRDLAGLTPLHRSVYKGTVFEVTIERDFIITL